MFAYRDLLSGPCADPVRHPATAQVAAPAHIDDTDWNEAAAS